MARTISICVSALEEPLQLKKERKMAPAFLQLQRCEACGAAAAVVLGSHLLARAREPGMGEVKDSRHLPMLLVYHPPSSYLFWLLHRIDLQVE